MINKFFIGQNLLSLSEKDLSEEKSYNQISSVKLEKENYQEEMNKVETIQESNYFKYNKFKNNFSEKNNITYIDDKTNFFINNKKKENNNSSDLLLLVDDFNSAYNSFSPIINTKSNDLFFTPNDDLNNFYFPIFNDGIGIKTKNNYLNQKFTEKISKKKEYKEIKEIFIIKKVKNKNNKKYKSDKDTINFEDKCFPFTTGKGIIYINSKLNIEEEELINNKSKLNRNPQENDLYLMKFNIRKYFINENGKKRRVVKKRKDNPDIIRKKLKSRFHKTIKTIINNNLKIADSEKLFDFLPQCFLINLTKRLNSKFFKLTYKELLSTDFILELNKTNDYKNLEIDKNNYLKNKEVLEYLDKNPNISKNSGFDIIKNMKYKDLLNNYFISKEFEDSLNDLKNEESQEYIQSYMYHAKNYIQFYTTNNSVENNIQND